MKTCSRCGWNLEPVSVQPLVLEAWPEGIPKPPPLPADANPHPHDSCPCPHALNDAVYWNIGGTFPDLPPVRGLFTGLHSFDGPEFTLIDNEWKKIGEPIGKAVFKIDRRTVHPALAAKLPDLASKDELVVFLEDLYAVDKWPRLIPPKE